MLISDCSSDVCSSDLAPDPGPIFCVAPAEVSLPAPGCGAATTGGTTGGSFGGGAATDAALACLLAAEALPLAFLLGAFDGIVSSRGGGGAGIAIAVIASPALRTRSEESRVGKACVRTCRSRWSLDH